MRITKNDIKRLATRINEITNSALEYSTEVNGKRVINVGHYCIGYAYGGCRLDRVCSDGGGISVISTNGYGTKRELYNWMTAFVVGLEYAIDNQIYQQ
jgi:hypothetical protein